MSQEPCAYPLIVHGNTGHYECAEPECSAPKDEHEMQVPCQWSWPYAHGRAYMGRPFPSKRCQHCRHIRRGGLPEIDLTEEHEASG